MKALTDDELTEPLAVGDIVTGSYLGLVDFIGRIAGIESHPAWTQMGDGGGFRYTIHLDGPLFGTSGILLSSGPNHRIYEYSEPTLVERCVWRLSEAA